MRVTLAGASRRLLVAATLAGLSACGDQSLVSSPEPVDPNEVVQPPPAYTELVRTVAIALGDQAARQELEQSLQSSPVVENKLSVSRTLGEPEGATLRGQMDRVAGEDGAPAARTQELLEQLPALEMYFPIPGHLKQWRSGSELIVASLWNENQDPVAFNTRGEPVKLSRFETPSTPTLFINPAESFDETGEVIPWERVGAPQYVIDESTGKVMTADEFDAVMRAGIPPQGAPHAADGAPAAMATTQRRGLDVQEKANYIRFWSDTDEVPGQGLPEFRILLAGRTKSGSIVKYNHPISKQTWYNYAEGNWYYKLGTWKSINLNTIYWASSYGNRIRVQCREDDYGNPFYFTVSGSTYYAGTQLNFSTKFKLSDADDNCGKSYLYSKKSDGTWTYIPTKSSGNYVGTSNLQWVGYGVK